MLLRIIGITLIVCSHFSIATINYNSEQSNFMGVTISEEDINSFVTELGKAGLYSYNSGVSYLNPPIGAPFAFTWWYNVQFPGLTNIRFVSDGNNGFKIGFRSDYIRLDRITSFDNPTDLRWVNATALPICSKDEFLEVELKTIKDANTGNYSVELKPCWSLAHLGLPSSYDVFLNKWLNENIAIFAIGEFFNELPEQLMVTAFPTTTVSDGTFMIGWKVKKEKRFDITPILTLLLD